MPNIAASFILVIGAVALIAIVLTQCGKPRHLTPEQAHHEAGLRGGQ